MIVLSSFEYPDFPCVRFWYLLVSSLLSSLRTNDEEMCLSTLRNRSLQPFLVSSTYLLSLVRKFATAFSITLSLTKGHDIFTLPVATTKSQLTWLCSLGVDVDDEAKDTGVTVSTNQKLRQKPVWHACAHFWGPSMVNAITSETVSLRLYGWSFNVLSCVSGLFTATWFLC